MRGFARKSALILGAMGLVAPLTACLTKDGKVRAPGARGSDDSILAEINGVATEDRTRQGVSYALICDSGEKSDGKISPDGKSVHFKGDRIKDGDKCAMEISLKKEDADKLEYDWFGIENGKERIGLLYGSDKKAVNNRSLALVIYKLYAPRAANTFTVKAAVSFEIGEGSTMPDAATIKGSMVCGPTEAYPGDFQKEGDKDGIFTFSNLKVVDFKAKTCDKLVALVNNVENFWGAAPELKIADPARGKVLSFPEVGKRFVLKPSATGTVVVITDPGKPCINFEGGECKDVGSVTLPWAKNYAVAKVSGRRDKGAGEKVTVFVGAGADGFGILEKAKLEVADLTKALAKDAAEADKKAFSWYKDAVEADLFKAPFDADFVAGKTAATQKMDLVDLEDVAILHIEKVWVHGMSKIDAEDLNKKTEARWFAHIKASKQGATDKEFIVAGKDKYFHSPAAPVTIDSKPYFFHYETLLSEMTGAGTSKWAVLAFKGGAMVPTGCEAELSHYKFEMSLRHLSNLIPDGGADAKIEACHISQADFQAAALGDGFGAVPQYYIWDWFAVR